MSQNEVIQVVLSVYDKSGTYSRHAGVVLTSLFSNTKSPVNVTILHDNTLTDDNRRRFVRTGERFGQSISFINVGEQISRVAPDPDNMLSHYTRGMLFRLLIPDILPIAKAIYLDCDIVVNLDIAELWYADIGDASLGAVRDEGFVLWKKGTIEKKRQREFKYTPDTYFSSGVLIMNLDKLRARHDLVRESFEFFSRYPVLARYGDQDFLNACCSGDVAFLDERFNSLRVVLRSIRRGQVGTMENTIIHFAGLPPSVWKCLPRIPEDVLYGKYFLASEWGDQMLDVLAEFVPDDAVSSRKKKPNPPFPVDRVPQGSSIVLYGAGGIGRAWYSALKLVKYCRIALWVDKRAYALSAPVMDVSKIKRAKYDYVVIAVSSRKIASEIADDLVANYGVAPERLVCLHKGDSI